MIRLYTRNLPIVLFSLFFLSACSVLNRSQPERYFSNQKQTFFFGYIVSDSNGTVVDSQHADSYFTPASTTKLFHSPLFLTLKNDTSYLTTGFALNKKDDSLQVQIFSSGDPVLKSSELDSIAQLINQKSIPVSSVTLFSDHFDSTEFWGNGWMWDDEPDDYQGFLNSFPMNENVLTLHYKRSNGIDSVWFEGINLPVVYHDDEFKITRIRTENMISISRPDSVENISAVKNLFSYRNPTFQNLNYFKNLLSAKRIDFKNQNGSHTSPFDFAVQHPFDSLMKQILTPSSNFCSEQSMRRVAINNQEIGSIKNGLSVEKNIFPNSKNRIVDGSGLSRYNLLTPKSILEVMKSNKGKFKIKTWFARYGKNGTLRDRFSLSDSTIQIYAKSGSMTGVQNLAAFVFSKEKFLGYAILYTNNTTESKDKRFQFEKEFLDYATGLLKK